MNSEDKETPYREISTQGIEIFDTKIDIEAHSLLDLGLKHQGIYYAYLQIANIKQISQGAWLWTSEFLPGGVSSLVIHICNFMRNSQAQNKWVLSLNTTDQMYDPAIKKLSESDIVMPRKQE